MDATANSLLYSVAQHTERLRSPCMLVWSYMLLHSLVKFYFFSVSYQLISSWSKFFLLHVKQSTLFCANAVVLGSWSENILQYFLRNSQITTEDGAQITWYHAANHKAQMQEALKSKSVWLLIFTLDGRWTQLLFWYLSIFAGTRDDPSVNYRLI